MRSFQEISLPFLEASIFLPASFKRSACCCCSGFMKNMWIYLQPPQNEWVQNLLTESHLWKMICALLDIDGTAILKWWGQIVLIIMRLPSCAKLQSRDFLPLSSVGGVEQFLVEKSKKTSPHSTMHLPWGRIVMVAKDLSLLFPKDPIHPFQRGLFFGWQVSFRQMDQHHHFIEVIKEAEEKMMGM